MRRPGPLARAVLCGLVAVLLPAVGSAETVTVQMTSVDFQPQFVPAEVTINPGDTVRWINTDPFLLDHATKSGTGRADPMAGDLWDSGILATSQYFEFTFDEEGVFEYFSVPHEFEDMFGVVVVTIGTNAPGGVEPSTWGKIKESFSVILPRE